MPGSRLPSERELTDALGVSRTTVASAYRELRDSGYLLSRRGSGSVTALPSKIEPELGRHHAPGIDTDGLYDFTAAAPSAIPGISAAVTEAIADLPVHLATPGYHPQGLPVLRAEIAAAYEERGLPTSPDQIIVTAGALAATSIAVRAITQIGDRVLTESPTHPNSVDSIRRSGCRVVAVPMSPGGWDLPLLEATIRQSSPRAAWLVVDFQNPTGWLMSASRSAAAGDRVRAQPDDGDRGRDAVRAVAGRAGDAAAVRVVRPGRGDHGRLGEQVVLGRAADRLDASAGDTGRPSPRRSRFDGSRCAGAGAVGGRAAAATAVDDLARAPARDRPAARRAGIGVSE